MNKILLVLLLAVFLKQMAWISFIPLWQTPDEQAHFGEVSLFSEIGGPKKTGNNLSEEIFVSEKTLGTNRDQFGNNKYTYHPEFNIKYAIGIFGIGENEIQKLSISSRKNFVISESTGYPPLYYHLASVIYKSIYYGSIFDRVFAVRILSAILLVGLTLVTFLIGKELFGKESRAIVLATLVGFHPMLSFVHSGVTSDSLFNFLFTLIIYFCLRLLTGKQRLLNLICLLILIYLGYETKPQTSIAGFIALPAVVIAAWELIKEKKISRKTLVWFIVAAIPVAAFLFRDLFWRLRTGNSLFPETDGPVVDSSVNLVEHTIFTLKHTYQEVLPWFWGVFRWLSLGMPPPLRQVTNLLTLASLFGLVLSYWLWSQKRKIDKNFLKGLFMVFTAISFFVFITAFDYNFRLSHGFSFGIQGRYFFPIIVPIMYIFQTGLTALVPKKVSGYLEIIIAIGMLGLCISTFFWVVGTYYSISLPQFFMQASQYKPVWLKFPINAIILTSFLSSTAVFTWMFITSALRTNSQTK